MKNNQIGLKHEMNSNVNNKVEHGKGKERDLLKVQPVKVNLKVKDMKDIRFEKQNGRMQNLGTVQDHLVRNDTTRRADSVDKSPNVFRSNSNHRRIDSGARVGTTKNNGKLLLKNPYFSKF